MMTPKVAVFQLLEVRASMVYLVAIGEPVEATLLNTRNAKAHTRRARRPGLPDGQRYGRSALNCSECCL